MRTVRARWGTDPDIRHLTATRANRTLLPRSLGLSNLESSNAKRDLHIRVFFILHDHVQDCIPLRTCAFSCLCWMTVLPPTCELCYAHRAWTHPHRSQRPVRCAYTRTAVHLTRQLAFKRFPVHVLVAAPPREPRVATLCKRARKPGTPSQHPGGTLAQHPRSPCTKGSQCP